MAAQIRALALWGITDRFRLRSIEFNPCAIPVLMSEHWKSVADAGFSSLSTAGRLGWLAERRGFEPSVPLKDDPVSLAKGSRSDACAEGALVAEWRRAPREQSRAPRSR